MEFSFSLSDIVEICAVSRVEGATAESIRGIASLNRAEAGDLSFLGNPRYRSAVPESRASAILVPLTHGDAPKPGQAFLFVENPSVALAKLCGRLESALWPRPEAGVHSSAVVDPSARIGAAVTIGPLCVIEADVNIGPRSWLEAGVFVGRAARVGADCRCGPSAKILAECVAGDRVILHSGAVIGSDGFGYETTGGKHEKLPQVGNVVLHDDVEVGANSTIDRARFSSTVIGEGTKIDNLVQIGHNVIIGRHCILCAQAGLAGTATLEDYVVLGGQAGTAGHLTIGRGSMLSGRTAVFSDLPPGSKVKGDPPLAVNVALRINALKKRLPELFKRVDALEARSGAPSGGGEPQE